MLPELIESAVIIDSVASTRKGDVLVDMVTALADAGRVAKRDIGATVRLLEEREALGSTGIGNGIAVPHAKSKTVKRPSLALARSAVGIDYQAIDGQPVFTVFMLLAPHDAPELHLRALRWVSSLARNGDFRRFVRGAKDATSVRELLLEMTNPG